MTFQLPADVLEYRETLRALCADKVAPNASAADANAEFPIQSWKALAEAGVTGLHLPEEYGGQAVDLTTWAVAAEEVARACAASAVTLIVNAASATLIGAIGTDDQRERYIPPAADGTGPLAFAQSEPHAGSDVSSIRTRARRDGDEWVLNGAKAWVTSAGLAVAYLVFVKTDPEAGAKGISLFIVDAETPGLSLGKIENKMGLRGSPTGELILEDARVPDSARLGGVNQAWLSSMGFLERSRPMIGAQAIGVAQAALDVALAYGKERKAFGQRILDFQGLQFMLADMAIGIETARAMVLRACAAIDAGPGAPVDIDPRFAASAAKAYASDVAMKVTTDAVQMLGAAGYVKDFPVERHMRDAKVFQIYEGTNQIQRWIIARHLIGDD